ncbi:MAG: GNAT family N-acetyltransferase [Planctomycetota bacterium]
MTLEIRPALPEELEALCAFLEEDFDETTPWGVREEYPLVFDETNRNNLFVAVENGLILSHVGVKPVQFRGPSLKLRLGLVGSVRTSPRHRGRGLARLVMQAAERRLFELGCELGMLWTSIPSFYEQFGWVIAGSEFSLEVPKSAVAQVAPVGAVRRLTPERWRDVIAMHEREPLRVLRDPKDYEALFSIPGTETWVLDTAEGPIAYGVMGKGRDFSGCLHEWCGSAASVVSLVRGMMEGSRREAMTVIGPPSRRDVLQAFEKLGVRAEPAALGMFKVLSGVQLARQIETFLWPAGIPWNLCWHDGGVILSSLTTGEPFELSHPEALRLLLGLGQERFALPEALGGDAVSELLPVPFYVWGLDSI